MWATATKRWVVNAKNGSVTSDGSHAVGWLAEEPRPTVREATLTSHPQEFALMGYRPAALGLWREFALMRRCADAH